MFVSLDSEALMLLLFQWYQKVLETSMGGWRLKKVLGPTSH